MSVAEIKDALRTLNAAELADIEQLAANLRQHPPEAAPLVREVQPSDAAVPAAMDAVFAKHRELLRRLAQ